MNTRIPIQNPSPQLTTTTWQIGGMHCTGCVQAITTAIEALPGVTACTVDWATAQATVTYDPGQTLPTAIAQAIAHLGYSTQLVTEPQAAL